MSDEPQVSRVVDLVSYQADAIVSRIVMKRDAGNVTLFAFDAGQELSEHTAPYDALVQVMDGEAAITSVDGRIASVPARCSSCPPISRTRSRRCRVSRCS